MAIRENILSGMTSSSRKILSNIVAVLLIIVLLSIGLSLYKGLEAKFRGVRRSDYLMGTIVEIRINGPDAKRHAKAAIEEMKRIAGLLNYHDENSELSNINRMAGITAVAVSQDTFEIIKRGLNVCRLTGGMYDITIGPLVDIWDFTSKDRKEIPSGNELAYAQHLVNYGNVEIDSRSETVKLLYPGMKIDLGGIAKGYAIAKARALLVERGVKSALISTGSSITVIGTNGDRNWRVGVKNPSKPDDIIGILDLKPGQALATSGDYERFFEIKGKRYHHILDPRTAMPAGGTKSVTIISDDAVLSDALSTAVFVMGPSRGLQFLRGLANVYAIIVDKDGNVLTTPGLILER